jgi:hypothetical protein
MSLEDYLLGPVVAVIWNSSLANKFPDADHHNCLQSFRYDDKRNEYLPLDPPLCHGWHCPLCGAATGSMGHKTCTAAT